jgi:hypothetical protein
VHCLQLPTGVAGRPVAVLVLVWQGILLQYVGQRNQLHAVCNTDNQQGTCCWRKCWVVPPVRSARVEAEAAISGTLWQSMCVRGGTSTWRRHAYARLHEACAACNICI